MPGLGVQGGAHNEDISSPQVQAPVAVRYDWADNPEGNLANSAGLPASPFRSDDWPGVTLTGGALQR